MTALVTERLHGLADTIAELKMRVRVALATELGRAVGVAVRDLLVIALAEGLGAPTREYESHRSARPSGWNDADAWNTDRDSWDEPARYESTRSVRDRTDLEPGSDPDPVPPAAAVAVGVQVGRWWFSRRGNLAGAIGAGVLAAALGLSGGPIARAALAVLAVTTDVLIASAVLESRDLQSLDESASVSRSSFIE